MKQLSHLVGRQTFGKQFNWIRIEEELKGPWLCFVAKLLFCLDCCPLSPRFPASPSKCILWLQFFYRQEAGGGRGGGFFLGRLPIFSVHQDHREGLSECCFLGPTPRTPSSVCAGPKMCVTSDSPGHADAAGAGTVGHKHLSSSGLGFKECNVSPVI